MELAPAASGAISMRLAAPRVSVPPSAARLTITPPELMPWAWPRANKNTEPFSLTLVLALMRPIWLTAMPTKVVLPRLLAISPS